MSVASRTTLIVGGAAVTREVALAAVIDPHIRTSIILEGLSDGIALQHVSPDSFPLLQLNRIAPGCLCCSGNLTMRVTLNRALRHPPEQLYISLANSAHLDNIRSFLMQAPYDNLLQLTKDIRV